MSSWLSFLHMLFDSLSQRVEIDGRQAVERAVDGRQRIFEGGGAIEKRGALAAADAPIGQALLERGIGGRAFRAHQEAFRARDLVDRRADRLVPDRAGGTAAFA